jgi:hypothetical protein
MFSTEKRTEEQVTGNSVMHIIKPSWQTEFESFVASAKVELRIAAPYYGKDVLTLILRKSKAGSKYFLLKLSDRDVLAGVQSPTAVRMLQDQGCGVRLGKELHAKILIADQRSAIVTSSNLTNHGLSGNAEMGVWIDDPNVVQALVRIFDEWYAKATVIDDSDLAKLETIQRKSKPQTEGKQYGGRILVEANQSRRPSIRKSTLGWILVHSKKYGEEGGEYESPQEELDKEYEPGLKWHWKRGNPLSEGDGFNILFAWKGEAFGEATASVTHAVEYKKYNFAFVLNDYIEAKNPVRLSDLGVRNEQNLVRLDKRMLEIYRRLAG